MVPPRSRARKPKAKARGSRIDCRLEFPGDERHTPCPGIVISVRRPSPYRPQAQARLCRPIFEALEQRQLLSTIDWVSTSSGSWDVASNWSTDTVPGPNDDVVIAVTGASPTVTISSNVESVQQYHVVGSSGHFGRRPDRRGEFDDQRRAGHDRRDPDGDGVRVSLTSRGRRTSLARTSTPRVGRP